MIKLSPKSFFYRFEFGYFKGLNLIDVYVGGAPMPAVLTKYLIESNLNKEHSKICEAFHTASTDGKYVTVMPKRKIYSFDLDKSVISNREQMLKYWEDERIEHNANISQIINDFFSNVFGNLFHESKLKIKSPIIDLNKIIFFNARTQEEECFSIAKNFSLFVCNGSPGYVEWCINNVANFFIPTEAFNVLENTEVKKYIGVKLDRVSDNTFKIIHLQSTYKYVFTQNTREVNESRNREFELNNIEWLDSVLNEEIFKLTDNTRTYTDQDYIDDAFGGEASAYWNID